MESGNAIIAKRIGLEIMKIPKKRCQFCIWYNLKMANKYLNAINQHEKFKDDIIA
tara:strand:- start:1 stop:165 length:165 start_codon:yes stop_codon:yes gene_type:complete